MKTYKGHVHSIESFGTLDGPGVRMVVFSQGCPLRCKYCHNPDTWEMNAGTEMTVDEIIEAYDKCKEFLKNGGITVTGGEPLMQIPFLTTLFQRCKELGINTCLDTSGITYQEKKREEFDKLMAVCDLVMLDIKHIYPKEHRELTGMSNETILAFANYLASIEKPMWVRHVVVPGITLKKEPLLDLGRFLGGCRNLKALDVLPFHKMGEAKYKNMGLEVPLADVPAATKEQAIEAREYIMQGIRERLIQDRK